MLGDPAPESEHKSELRHEEYWYRSSMARFEVGAAWEMGPRRAGAAAAVADVEVNVP